MHPEIAAEALAGLGEPPAATSSAAHPPARTLFSSKDVRLPAGLQHSLAVEAEAQRQAKVRVSQRGAGPPPTEAEAERADRVPAASSPPPSRSRRPPPDEKSSPKVCSQPHGLFRDALSEPLVTVSASSCSSLAFPPPP